MSADTAGVVLVALAAPAATLYAIIYAFTAPWWRTAVGRALMTKAVGLALLIDISIAYQAFGDDYPGRDYVRLTVYALITAGVWMQLGALLNQRYRARRGRGE